MADNESEQAAAERMGLDSRPAEGWPNYSEFSSQPADAATAARPMGLDVYPGPASGLSSSGS